MAIPSGSGTEVLKAGHATITGTTQTKLIDGVANHIYTVLSVNICEIDGNSETFTLGINLGVGGVTELIKDQVLAPKKTFVYNDRIVLTSSDELFLTMGGTCNVDAIASYVDQDWT